MCVGAEEKKILQFCNKNKVRWEVRRCFDGYKIGRASFIFRLKPSIIRVAICGFATQSCLFSPSVSYSAARIFIIYRAHIRRRACRAHSHTFDMYTHVIPPSPHPFLWTFVNFEFCFRLFVIFSLQNVVSILVYIREYMHTHAYRQRTFRLSLMT